MMGIVSETWNLRVLLLLSPPGHTQPLSSTSKAPARAGEAEAPSPSGFTHWQAASLSESESSHSDGSLAKLSCPASLRLIRVLPCYGM